MDNNVATTLDPLAWARKVVDAASEKQATDILLLDIRGISPIADYFVLLSAETSRQMKTLQQEIEQLLAELGVASPRTEGSAESGWILVDAGDVVIHLLTPEARDYYRLEEVWSKARTLLRIQ